MIAQRWRGVIASLALVACASAEEPSAATAVGPEASTGPDVAFDTVATSLSTPWGIATTRDGRIFATERNGCLLRIAGERRITLGCLDVYAEHPNWHPESGLMGLALDPDFTSTSALYVYATVPRDPAPAAASTTTRLLRRLGLASPSPADLAFENRIYRLVLRGDSIVERRSIVVGIPTSHYHAGGALAFGPDGMLYATVGDGRIPPYAQDSTALIGKILRYRADGSVPPDNPIPGSPVWAWGFRNPQGLAWLPDGTLFAIDHGPSGLEIEGQRMGRDELNVVRRGANYGWPTVAGVDRTAGDRRDSGATVAPIRVWHPAVAPAALAYEGSDATGAHHLLVARLRGGLERISVEQRDGTWSVTRAELFALADLRRLRGIHRAGEHQWLVGTSNIGVRGVDHGADDLLVRVTIPVRAP